jgi:hypothetical protein
MKGFTRSNRLVMKVNYRVLNLKLWSYQKDHNRFATDITRTCDGFMEEKMSHADAYAN